LQHEYLDIVLNATQQDLLVKLFSVASENPKLPIPPTPSLSHQAATSLFSKSMIFFSVEMFICAGYYLFVFLRPHPRHMEVPRLGVKSEL